MTPLERAGDILERLRREDGVSTAELARLVAEALFPKEPAPERIRRMSGATGLRSQELSMTRAYAAERRFMGLE